MLHILLMILKIIGCTVVSLLVLLLLLAAAILFVPVRYRISGDGEWKGEPAVHIKGRVSWLLHIVSFHLEWEGETPKTVLRLFGIPVKLKRKKGGGKGKKKKPKKKAASAKKKNELIKQEKVKTVDENNDNEFTVNESTDLEEADKNKNTIEEIIKEENIIEENTADDKSTEANDLKENAAIDETVIESSKEKNIITPDENEGAPQASPLLGDSGQISVQKKQKRKDFGGWFLRICRRIKDWFRKIWYSFKKTAVSIAGIPAAIGRRFDQIRAAKEKVSDSVNKIKAFLTDEGNKSALHTAYAAVKKLLKHLRPKKLRAQIVFGTGDLYVTGQILTFLSIFYGVYGKNISVYPEWEEKMIEGNFLVSGRIRIFTLAVICIKLIRNEEIKQLRTNALKLKEELT